MVKIKPLEEISKRYEESASIVPERYKRGIQAVTGWKDAATSDKAEELYAAKLSEAISAKRRQKALQLVDENTWKKNAIELGGARIGDGMRRKGVEKHKKNYAPYREALAALELPEKTADPMANIDNRLKAVVRTLIEKKKELKG
ncbi:MAG: hypothetical protein B6U76_09735 [Desulfurococcales archaeon ex4484_217_2]|nr:MAG: hypothetical protein B6U76_09735 [Desulfurococcales archaeon ex4484_217_2]